jgi:hypothetical protein
VPGSRQLQFLHDADSLVKYGLGVTAPNEMAGLFELLARARGISPAADSSRLTVLGHNEDMQMEGEHP